MCKYHSDPYQSDISACGFGVIYIRSDTDLKWYRCVVIHIRIRIDTDLNDVNNYMRCDYMRNDTDSNDVINYF